MVAAQPLFEPDKTNNGYLLAREMNQKMETDISKSAVFRSIVLTGGPCGGKTTLMRELRIEYPGNNRWLMVPEAAPLLFHAGLDGKTKHFQRSVVSLQIALENACAIGAKPGKIILCHRGTLDPLAYWLYNGWSEKEFFDYIGMTRSQHYQRYFGVIHLQTTAFGVEDSYRTWPDAHRTETPEQAAEIDRLLSRAWNNHPRYVMVSHDDPGWDAKSRFARDILNEWLNLVND